MIVRTLIANTIRDLARRKLLWLVLLMILGMSGCTSTVLRQMETDRSMALDTSEFERNLQVMRGQFAAMISLGVEMGAFVMALLLGAATFPIEVESRNVHTVLAKGVSRPAFVLGKYLGSAMLLSLYLATAIPIALWGLRSVGLEANERLWIGVAGTVVTAFLWFSLTFAFSTIAGSISAGMLTIASYFVASWATKISDTSHWLPLARVVRWVAPEWSLIPGINTATSSSAVAGNSDLWGLLHGADYSVILLLLAMWIFKRRELG